MTDYRQVALAAARKYGVDPRIFMAQIQQESGFNPAARSPAGALGIAQFMPGTARGMGVNPMDPVDALYGAARLMAGHLKSYGGDYKRALAAYNAGPGAVAKYGGVPPYKETQNYVARIMGAAGGQTLPAPAAGAAAPSPNAPAASDHHGHDHGHAPMAGRMVDRAAVINHILRGGARGLARAIPGMVQQAEPAPPAPAMPSYNAPTGPPAVPPAPAGGPVNFAAAPDYTWAQRLAKQYGLQVTSTFRDPGMNAGVGGSRGSRHMTRGAAVDLGGSPEQMRRLAEWAGKSGLFAEVFYDPWGQWDNGRYSRQGIGGHSDHVHLSFGAPGLDYFYGGRR